MKKCPWCAEEIQDEAVVCRFCQRDLRVTPTQAPPPAPPKKSSHGCLLAVVFAVGLLCLPLFLAAACPWGRPASRPATSAAPAASTPAVPPAPAFPSLSSGDVRVPLERLGLSCEGPTRDGGGRTVSWVCQGELVSRPGTALRVEMVGANPMRIQMLDASVMTTLGTPSDPIAAGWFADVAGLAGLDLRAWLTPAQLAKGGEMTTPTRIRVTLDGPPRARSMTLRAVE